jgi:hypothetical protein
MERALSCSVPPWARTQSAERDTRTPLLAVSVLLCLLVPVWGVARTRNVYRERPANQLVYRLDGVFPGARFLRTDANTYALILDLRRAIRLAGARPFAVIPDFAGYWACAPERNPLGIDWPNSFELGSPMLFSRITRDLERLRGHGTVILQKVGAHDIAKGFIPFEDDDSFYTIVPYVRSHFRKTAQTQWFELYQ